MMAGYKHTQLGVIPTEWDVESIANLAAITTGDKNTQDRVADGKYPFFVRSATVERINSYAFDGEAVLTAGDGVGTGKIFHYINGKFDFHQRVYKISHFGSRLDAYFFYLYFSNYFYSRMMQMTAKSSVDSVRREMIAKMMVPVPPFHEQRAIATALSDVDALLAKLDALIAKKSDLKQAAMQQLLTGQTRLPGFSAAWTSKSILELADYRKELFDDGDWIEAEFLTGKGVRLLQTGNIGNGCFVDKENKKYISTESFKKLRCKGLQVGDILICRLAHPAGRACILPNLEEERVITAVDVTIFRPLTTVADRRYLAQVFNTPSWFAAVSERCGGSTRTRIARGSLGRMEISVPPVSEQTAIATVLCDIDTEIVALEARRDKTRALKQGMMQELLTGRIRLV